MLVENSKKSGIKSLKLSNGEEILGDIIEDNPNDYVVDYPMSLAMTPNGVALVPFSHTLDPKHKPKISKSHVMAVMQPLDMVAKDYEKQSSDAKLKIAELNSGLIKV